MQHVLGYPAEQVGEERLQTSDTLLGELAEEARRYLGLLAKLQDPAIDCREDLEAELYASISHFKTHSDITLECLDDLVDALPNEEEVHA